MWYSSCVAKKHKGKTMDTKKCTKCGEIKELDQFFKNKRHKDGFQYDCKECRRVDQKSWKKANPEKVKAGRKRYKKSNPKKLAAIQRNCHRKKILGKANKSTKHTYLITDGEFVKIGSFTDGKLDKRLSMLQTGNPRKLSVIATSASNVEKLCHYEFEHLGALGEWFKMDLEIITFFTENAV